MGYKTIPIGVNEIQPGLFLHTRKKVINNKEYTFRELFSAKGYCFYDKTEEIYKHSEEPEAEPKLLTTDEEKEFKRNYMTYASLGLLKDVTDFVSVPVKEKYTIV